MKKIIIILGILFLLVGVASAKNAVCDYTESDNTLNSDGPDILEDGDFD